MIYFLIYLFLEVLVSVQVASAIGGLYTFFEIIGSGMLGIAILFNFRNTLAENVYALKNRHIDVNGFHQRNLFSLLGAILLILPGFVTDFIGLLLQFSLFSSLLVNRFLSKYTTSKHSKDEHVIDAEIISDTPHLR